MRFEFTFNPALNQKQNDLNFNLTWKPLLSKTKTNVLNASAIFLIGALFVYWGYNVAWVMVVIGLHFMVNSFYYYRHYRKVKRNYADLVESFGKEYSQAGEKLVWEFLEDSFHYSDFKCDITVRWEAFDGYRVIENSLFMDTKAGGMAQGWILDPNEVGQENFDKIISFLDEKIKTDSQKPDAT